MASKTMPIHQIPFTKVVYILLSLGADIESCMAYSQALLTAVEHKINPPYRNPARRLVLIFT
jgi:hypothetical protein